MLSNRIFTVNSADLISRKCRLNNGLPQRSVLASILFNLYINDIPRTCSKKFMYADDIAIACQSKCLHKCECILTTNLQHLELYIKNWRLIQLKLKPHNKMADYKLKVSFNGKPLSHQNNLKYLEIH